MEEMWQSERRHKEIQARIERLNTDLRKQQTTKGSGVLGVCSQGDSDHADGCGEEYYRAKRGERFFVGI
ncbi:hypothetical protein V6N11_031406 [Hibiscus sabdariffa]|uniref:Uncharacterized protein n=1 Tax=Hibiscus sabdariffa TaxID=183260 RepID=A0ABR2SXJ7_9ROSI